MKKGIDKEYKKGLVTGMLCMVFGGVVWDFGSNVVEDIYHATDRYKSSQASQHIEQSTSISKDIPNCSSLSQKPHTQSPF